MASLRNRKLKNYNTQRGVCLLVGLLFNPFKGNFINIRVGDGRFKRGQVFFAWGGDGVVIFATHFLETVYKGVFIIYVPGGAADLGAGAEKSRRDLGGAEKNPVDV